jgi:rod shape-determining protein MreB
LPKTVEISSSEIQLALKETVESIVEGIKECLEKTPPGLLLISWTGESLWPRRFALKRLDKLIGRETHMPVYVCEEPLLAVAGNRSRAGKH